MALSSSNDPDANKLSPHGSKAVPMSAPNLANSADYYPSNVEFCAPLENSVPLEAPRLTYRVPLNPATASPDLQQGVQPSDDHQNVEQPSDADTLSDLNLGNSVTQSEGLSLRKSGVTTRAEDATIIPLLEERLVVDRHKRKVGEVIVRKEIETYIVEVPVRREKLIVEQVSPEFKQLAVVDLGQVQADDIGVSNASTLGTPNNHLSSAISAKFTSAHAAIEFLEAIAAHSNSDSTAVQISLVLADKNMKAAYQRWLEQHSN